MGAYERRKIERYRAKERALLAMGPGRENMFHLLDISRGGVGFRYIGREKRTSEMKEVDLYFQGDLWLTGVKVCLVQDIPMVNGLIPFRRCSLRFADLSGEQAEKLASYLEKASDVEA